MHTQQEMLLPANDNKPLVQPTAKTPAMVSSSYECTVPTGCRSLEFHSLPQPPSASACVCAALQASPAFLGGIGQEGLPDAAAGSKGGGGVQQFSGFSAPPPMDPFASSHNWNILVGNDYNNAGSASSAAVAAAPSSSEAIIPTFAKMNKPRNYASLVQVLRPPPA